jgi:hypothetical protein
MSIKVQLEKPLERVYWRREEWKDGRVNDYTKNYLWAILPFEQGEPCSERRELYLGDVVYHGAQFSPWLARCGGKSRSFENFWDGYVWMKSLLGDVIVEPDVTDHSKPNETPQELSPEDAIYYTEKLDYSVFEWRVQTDTLTALCRKSESAVYGHVLKHREDCYVGEVFLRMSGVFYSVSSRGEGIKQFTSENAAKAWVLHHAAKDRALTCEYAERATALDHFDSLDEDVKKDITTPLPKGLHIC